MILYVDENMPKHLARGFEILQKPESKRDNFHCEVRHLNDEFESGIKDLEWINALKDTEACILTRDINISRRKDELEAYKKAGLGMFFIKGKSKKEGLSVWEMVELLAKHWPKIIETMKDEKRPFAMELSLKGKMTKMA